MKKYSGFIFGSILVASFGVSANEYQPYLMGGMSANGSDNISEDSRGAEFGKQGSSKDNSYNFEVGVIEKVENMNFANRFSLNYHNNGHGEEWDGFYNYQTDASTITANYDLMFKVNNFFQPYIGVGLGIQETDMTYNDSNTDTGRNPLVPSEERLSKTSVDVVGTARVGVQSELYRGIILDLNMTHYKSGLEREAAGGEVGDSVGGIRPVRLDENVAYLNIGYRF